MFLIKFIINLTKYGKWRQSPLKPIISASVSSWVIYKNVETWTRMTGHFKT